MKFYSTSKNSKLVDFKTALFLGLAPDGGLYMPETIGKLSDEVLGNLSNLSFQEIAFHVTKAIIAASIPDQDLKKILAEVLTFDAPVVKVKDNIYSLELWHGPTMAFKDFGARFMAACISYYLEKSKEDLTILVATSGDTGSAVAHGFLGKAGIKVILLYPEGKVSEIQEKQLTTMGQNITALEVNGTFATSGIVVYQNAGSTLDLTIVKVFLIFMEQNISHLILPNPIDCKGRIYKFRNTSAGQTTITVNSLQIIDNDE